jgi:hypothetical protein
LKQDRWIAVTAGLGSENFEGAALRVKESFKNSGIVDEVVAVLTQDLAEVCPHTSKIYSEFMNSEFRGYGFYSWKAEIIKAAFDGHWGKFDGVVWIDSGCEVSINPISKIRFEYFKRYANKFGVASFTLSTKEIEYTKRDIFEQFPMINPHNAGEQIQATWMLFQGDLGKTISNQWFNLVCSGTNLLDFGLSKNTEYAEFIENRNDQSAFSMVCKDNNVRVMNYKPTAGTGSFPASLKGFFHPIWISRNRTPKTIKKYIHQFFEI